MARWILPALWAGVVWAQAAAKVDFDREIRPILSDTCFQCHGPDETKRMAKLRLDTKDGAAGVVAAGDARSSKLYQRISHEKKALRMPPEASGLKLSGAQVEKIRQWIDGGARWEEHWSFAAPQRRDPPAVKLASWPRNGIDRFVLARLEKEGLKPAPEADRTTLLRRLTLDLTGLPPAPQEVDAYLADKSPAAYEKVVDRLLESPRYGERMALMWLDLARYADTHGYHIDSHRDMWPWRDWVINAFNTNMPYDRFTVEQLAGDLLPDATRAQKIASGFNRNHMINFEGGAIAEEYQNEYVVDRVEATATTWLGLTMGCARCHDHKYDPIRQQDFYRFGAFFNTVSEKGLDGREGNAPPVLYLTTGEQQREWDAARAAAAGRRIALQDQLVDPWLEKWEKERGWREPRQTVSGLRAWYELDASLSDLAGGFRHGRLRSGEVTYGASNLNRAADFDGLTHVEFPRGALEPGQAFTLAVWLRSSRQLETQGIVQMRQGGRAFELVAPATDVLPRLRRGYRLTARWSEGAGKSLVLRAKQHLLNGALHHVAVSHDGSGQAAGVQVWVDGEPCAMDVVEDTLPAPLALSAPLEVGNKEYGARFRGRLDELRIYDRVLGADEVAQMAQHYPAGQLMATVAPTRRTKEQMRQMREYFLVNAAPEEMRRWRAELKALERRLEDFHWTMPSTMVMAEMETPRESHVLGRGDYREKREKVTPGAPAFLPPLAGGKQADRLALAEWLVDPNHPLTGRVTVNRLWQTLFGQGLVKTSEDFGSQGEGPLQAELLDWLATEFVRGGWDVKAALRRMVGSATYRQSSVTPPALRERDPENRLLARGPRFRLQAELVRDAALAASGLMNHAVGGASVRPYQPAGLWEELAFGDVYSAQAYVQDHGEKLYRRSMYTFWKRTAPPASMSIFDAPDREKCTARRPLTNTPLQALALMNDTTFVEAARALAGRAMEGARGDEARLRLAFRLATARYPDAKEMKVLRGALARQRTVYAKDPEAAGALVKVGESPAPAAFKAQDLAAWTNVCSVILNLDETVTKE
jgi:hypothetical protein